VLRFRLSRLGLTSRARCGDKGQAYAEQEREGGERGERDLDSGGRGGHGRDVRRGSHKPNDKRDVLPADPPAVVPSAGGDRPQRCERLLDVGSKQLVGRALEPAFEGHPEHRDARLRGEACRRFPDAAFP